MVLKEIQSSMENTPQLSMDSKISHTDNSFHFVLLAGREIHRKIGDVAGFDADHLHPFIIRKI